MKFYIYSIFIFTVLFGCAEKKEVIIQDRSQLPDANGKVNDGGGDWGGGAIVTAPDGSKHSIDSLIINPKDREDFVQTQVILKNLDVEFNQLAADFLHILKHRKWYFVPTSLKNIPSYVTGIGTAIDYKQIALQNDSSVWVDKLLFESSDFSFEQRTMIYMHELVVGLKILDITNDLDQCLAKAAKYLTHEHNDAKQFSNEERSCRLKYLDVYKPGKISISEKEYDGIRSITNMIVTNAGKIDRDYIHLLLHSNNFKRYKLPTEQLEKISEKLSVEVEQIN